MHNFRKLKVWQRAMTLTVWIYRETQKWPTEEKFGLISQTRRASYSIPLNIAEGAGNSSKKEFRRFLQMALRSAYEVMTATDIARGLEYISNQRADSIIKEADEIAAMIAGLMKSLGWRNRDR